MHALITRQPDSVKIHRAFGTNPRDRARPALLGDSRLSRRDRDYWVMTRKNLALAAPGVTVKDWRTCGALKKLPLPA